MKKINLFYLLFALSSFHSLSADNLKPPGILRWWYKYSILLSTDKLTFIETEDDKGNIETSIIQNLTIEIANIEKIGTDWLTSQIKNKSDLRKLSETLYFSDARRSIKRVLKGEEFITIDQLDGPWEMVNSNDFPYTNNEAKKLIKEALRKGRVYVFYKEKNQQGELHVKSFNFLEVNYEGRFKLLGLGLVLVAVLAYSLDFFSSSETEKKDETDYLAIGSLPTTKG